MEQPPDLHLATTTVLTQLPADITARALSFLWSRAICRAATTCRTLYHVLLLTAHHDALLFRKEMLACYPSIVLSAMEAAQERGARLFAICNVLGSQATRISEGAIYTHAGPEIGVASTKAFTTQLVALYLFALYLRQQRGMGIEREHLSGLAHLPQAVAEALGQEAAIEEMARRYFRYEDFLYLGRGLNYPIALEGALKLKEISYSHAEGYPAGEMKHGPIALIDEDFPVVAIATGDRVFDKVCSNMQEVKARDGIVIAITDRSALAVDETADEVIQVPNVGELLQPLVNVIPLQLLAYFVAVRRGADVDQPRNLAKSVTVE